LGTIFSVICLLMATLSGCFPRGKPPYLIEQYILDYPSPTLTIYEPTYEALTVARFTVAQSVNSPAMVYMPDNFRMASYQYYRWRNNPGDMVSDFLTRDLRNTNLFTAVFSYRDGERTRFMLEGGVEEFYEVDKGGLSKAVLTLYVVLLDLNEHEINNRVVFQKRYHTEEPLTEQTPKALARAMSAAMAKISEQIIQDVYSAIIEM